eukprot:8008392-Ditylum_brightwellii.AAC.1
MSPGQRLAHGRNNSLLRQMLYVIACDVEPKDKDSKLSWPVIWYVTWPCGPMRTHLNTYYYR